MARVVRTSGRRPASNARTIGEPRCLPQRTKEPRLCQIPSRANGPNRRLWPSRRAVSSKVRFNRVDTARSFLRTPACYGFTIIAKIIPGREEAFHAHAKTIEKAVADQPDCLAVLKLHYLRWVLFPIKGETYFMYQGIFDTDFDKYTEDAVSPLWRDRHQHCLRKPRRLPCRLEDESICVRQVRSRASMPEFP